MFSSLVHLILSLSISCPYLIKFHDFADNSQEGMKPQRMGATQTRQAMTLQITLFWSEWPRPHDCTSSIWDELRFIPIIGSAAGIWGWVFSFLFFPLLTSRLPIKKIIRLPKHFKPQLSTSTPPKTLNLTASREQKWCCRRWCYRSNVVKDGATKAMLKCCYKRQCCKGGVEVML